MRLVLSPYHLTTREPAAMAALLLADEVITLLPLPPAGIEKEQVRRALRQHPRYARLLESWRWSFPLWREGLIVSIDHAGDDALSSVRAAAERIQHERAFAGLRAFLHADLFGPAGDDPDVFAGDVLKGGPDPGVCVPVGAGLDAFAAPRRMVVVRAGASRETTPTRGAPGQGPRRPSLAQQAEARLAATVFTCALPVLVQAAPATILAARAALAGTLSRLRAAMEDAFAEHSAGGSTAVRGVAAEHAAAFDHWLAGRRGHDDDAGVQVLDGYVRVTAQRLPADAVLRSASVAARAVRPRPVPHGPAPEAATVLALVIDPMSARPAVATAHAEGRPAGAR